MYNRKIIIEIEAFCCDAPARAFIKNTKGHNAYYGCDKCIVQGTYLERRMVYLESECERRTDASFNLKTNKEHHKGNTPLADLSVGLVSCFPIDYMHCVCLGIMRKLLFQWRDGSPLYRINANNKIILDQRINNIQGFWPCEFNRKPRSLRELEHWKATELRQFLVYVGQIVLIDLLPPNVYANFMVLKYAITILLSEKCNTDYNDYASELLKLFVKHVALIYGQQCCTYNFHAVVHLPDDAKKFGSLDNVSCFPFKNYLQFLKRLCRKSNLPLEQIVHRIHEGRNLNCKKPGEQIFVCGEINVKKSDLGEDLARMPGGFYKKNFFGRCTFTLKCGNDCIFLKCGSIVLLRHIHKKGNQITLFGKKLDIIGPFTCYPENSNFLSIYKVKLSQDENLLRFTSNSILCKSVFIPLDIINNVFVCHPLL